MLGFLELLTVVPVGYNFEDTGYPVPQCLIALRCCR